MIRVGRGAHAARRVARASVELQAGFGIEIGVAGDGAAPRGTAEVAIREHRIAEAAGRLRGERDAAIAASGERHEARRRPVAGVAVAVVAAAVGRADVVGARAASQRHGGRHHHVETRVDRAIDAPGRVDRDVLGGGARASQRVALEDVERAQASAAVHVHTQFPTRLAERPARVAAELEVVGADVCPVHAAGAGGRGEPVLIGDLAVASVEGVQPELLERPHVGLVVLGRDPM